MADRQQQLSEARDDTARRIRLANGETWCPTGRRAVSVPVRDTSAGLTAGASFHHRQLVPVQAVELVTGSRVAFAVKNRLRRWSRGSCTAPAGRGAW